jgi:hypothetical protein
MLSVIGGLVILVLSSGQNIASYLTFMFAGMTLIINATIVQRGHLRQRQLLTQIAELREEVRQLRNQIGQP